MNATSLAPAYADERAARRQELRGAPSAGQDPGGRRRWLRSFRRYRTAVLLATILGIASAARLINLNAVGFNSDEAVYAGQGAALAGNEIYSQYFPVFRAHPMLIQTMLSFIYREGEHDVAGRVLIAAFGVATVGLVFMLGRQLYNTNVGLLGALLLAIMPYHVIVTRQVLLDGPMVFFATATLMCVATFVKTQRVIWMLAGGAALGLTMLSKESSIVLVGAVYAFFALTPSVRRPVVGSLLGFSVTVALFALHPISVALTGHTSTTKAYLVWQLVRRPNHTFTFYAEVVPFAIGLLVTALAFVAVWRARRLNPWREVLLAAWILVPFAAFTLWPVKGFQYLLAAAPAVAILAARALLTVEWRLPRWLPLRRSWLTHRWLRPLMVVIAVVSLLIPLAPQLGPNQGSSSLAGSGGVAGGRQMGLWVRENTPEGAEFLTLGPSMANLVQFYGQRRAFGLSVSPNPLRRNPSYTPIVNPDASLRRGDLQYIVWDAYSAERSTHFSEKVQLYARRYNGRIVHTEHAVRYGERVPVIVVWAVRP